MELRRQLRSQIEFGNEEKSATVIERRYINYPGLSTVSVGGEIVSGSG